ncbi:DUF5691 domain-containing protein [Mycolicibacterium neworleansense]|uniref:Uncharacterized protein n=1 Tax=Mycolicibacterium neworleansense TaxID=146018 RepID=A0A0H5SC61_9MYCO|nr:DUF5691 domain-containing protein [Mycolicibacterium neworleansense]MCV7363722.1 hypothetical protein [Mycolicibacterium neworleansense]CRZ19074.1 hypothetical protein BN2156_05989 [Mycolicibacterium neworleansense]
MSDYQRMISAATVGFGARPFPEGTFDPPVDGSVAAVYDAGDPVGSVLRVAGLYATARRAGRLPERVEPATDPAPPETRPLITDAHGFLIERALTARPILDGALADIAAAGLRLPPRLIPELLRLQQSGVVTRALWDAIGNSGQWYALEHYGRNHRALRHVVQGRPTDWPKESDFTHGDTAKRLDWLATARALDPERARELVATHWSTEDAESRAALLAAFTSPEYDADEPFLEAALDDRAVTVRAAAVAVLGRRDRSRYLDRMKALAAHIFTVKKSMLGVKIAVHPLPGPDAAAIRDGLSTTKPEAVVARTPITFWAEVFGAVTPEKVARALYDTDQSVLAALTLSALRGNDPKWAVPLLQRCLPDDYGASYDPATAHPAISAEMIRALTHTAQTAPLVRIVASLPRPFAPDVAAALFGSLAGAGWGTARQRREAAAHLAAGYPLDWLPRLAKLADLTADEELHKFYATIFELLTLRFDLAKELR